MLEVPRDLILGDECIFFSSALDVKFCRNLFNKRIFLHQSELSALSLGCSVFGTLTCRK